MEQEAAFQAGTSPLHYPHSKHNRSPSLAVDVAPSPLNWENLKAFDKFAEVVFATAKELGIKVVWGKTFKNVDRPHWELAE